MLDAHRPHSTSRLPPSIPRRRASAPDRASAVAAEQVIVRAPGRCSPVLPVRARWLVTPSSSCSMATQAVAEVDAAAGSAPRRDSSAAPAPAGSAAGWLCRQGTRRRPRSGSRCTPPPQPSILVGSAGRRRLGPAMSSIPRSGPHVLRRRAACIASPSSTPTSAEGPHHPLLEHVGLGHDPTCPDSGSRASTALRSWESSSELVSPAPPPPTISTGTSTSRISGSPPVSVWSVPDRDAQRNRRSRPTASNRAALSAGTCTPAAPCRRGSSAPRRTGRCSPRR